MKATKMIVQYRNSGLNCDIVESGDTFTSGGVRQLFVLVFILNVKLRLLPIAFHFIFKPHL